MKILYLDTSSSFLYAGIVDDDNLLASISKDFGRDLSTHTLSEIRNLFSSSKISTGSVDKIIVVNGPGSFTGIRIGLTIAKTYAWSLNIKISTISSLDAMALSSADHDYYIPIIDARRGYVYAGIYDKEYKNVLTGRYIKLDQLLKELDSLSGTKQIITNDKFDLNMTSIPYKPDILKIVKAFKEKENINPHGIDALYLKLTEAEENKLVKKDE